jgi:uncharacterized membrane protein
MIITSGILLLLFDAMYLSLVSKHYSKMITNIQGSKMKMKMIYAVLCYIFLIGLINYFIIRDKRDYKDAFLLGLGVYGVFEFTNAAIIDGWELWAVVTDTLWGGILFALVTLATYKAHNL